ncbi:alcohol dehydrogenase [Frondihabitans sp. PAMC 28766]|uniref:NADP-dependent oxidoreductase n=1 Tax=Frondihabitans sp. PAMC 28766 TaxID=1795630 RepID=UPI00078EA112|nr:NADP-dependent oxidoreductase [Frondihabitans sp. PAMC 28766]AMM19341.1 alcohol dehydrogenase [Frondihabitans sp. PAMC 28766]
MSAVESRAVRFHEVGEPLDVLVQEQVEVPDPGAGRIRVRVRAAGLNPADWELCRGFMPGALPRGIGFDVAGTVDAIGDGVDDVSVGDLVFGSADFVAQPSAGVADIAILNLWFAVPEGLDAARAAVLPMVLETAVWTLDLMDIQPGETVLVHGAGGMVGFAAVQVALGRGARVIATAGPTFASDLEAFGASVTAYGDGMVDRVRALANGGVDHALDVSRPNPGAIAALIEITGDPRRVVTISNHDEARGQGARVNVDELMAAGGFPSADFLADYAALAAAGDFTVPVVATFPFDEWRAAAELSLSGAPHGKVVLVP